MKKLLSVLILIWVTIIGISQSVYNDSISLNRSGDTTFLRVPEPDAWIYRPITRTPVTLGDLLEYRSWCYNDSTLGQFTTLYKYDEPSKEYIPIHTYQEYNHLHYPQFDEFINWMEARYKKKK